MADGLEARQWSEEGANLRRMMWTLIVTTFVFAGSVAGGVAVNKGNARRLQQR
jgi:hypothetical protein